MAIWKCPRVTTIQRLALTPQASELLYDTDEDKYYGGDGVTLGGIAFSSAAGTVTSVFTRTGSVTATNGDYTASQVTNVPSGNIAATTIQGAIDELESEKISVSEKGAISGVAPLGVDQKISTTYLPTAILGGVNYQGVWDASTNTPALVSSTGSKGYYYTVSVAGSTTLDGISSWVIGDHVIYNGTVWEKIDNTDAVASVFGRTGSVTATNGDYTATQVTNTPNGNVAATTVQAAINELDSDKEPVVSVGTSAQYYRGDKTFQTLNTDATKYNYTQGAVTTVTDANKALSYSWSAGVISGCDITDNGNGTVAIAAGEAMLRSSASQTAQLYTVIVPANSSVTLADLNANYVYADYNGGAPVIVVNTDINSFNCMDKCVIAVISRQGNHLHIVDGRHQNIDGNRKLRRKYLETEPYKWVPGGTSLGATGLAITMTAGKFWFALEPMLHSSVDTSIAGTGYDKEFSAYYRSATPGVWNTQTGQKTVSNTLYDNGTGTLATLSNNNYTIHWVYLLMGTNTHIATVYGQAQYSTLALAQAATTPSSLPPVFEATSILIGRLIVLKSAVSVAVVESAFTRSFSGSTATDHNNLSNLQGSGVVNEYYHLNASQYSNYPALVAGTPTSLHQHYAYDLLLGSGVGVTDLTTARDAFRHIWSTGITEGCNTTDNGNGTFNIASGELSIRTSDTDDALLSVVAIAAAGPFTPADDDVTYYFVNYNSGTPVWQSGTSISDYNGTDKVQGFSVGRRGTSLFIIDSRRQNVDANRKIRRRDLEWSGNIQNGFWHTRGGTTLGATGLALTLSSGKFYYSVAPVTHIGFDTTVAGTANANVFDYYYNRSAYTYTANSKTINTTQYDNAGTLTTMGNNQFRTDWAYVVLDGATPRFVVILGNAEYTSLTLAQAAPVPTTIPQFMDGIAVLVGQVVIQKSAATVTARSAFGSMFTPAAVTDHNTLSNIQGGAANEAYHLSLSEYNGTGTGTVVRATNPAITNPTVNQVTFTDGSVQTTASLSGVESPVILFNTASPVAVATLPTGKFVVQINVLVPVAFNGIGATVTVGTDATPDLLVSSLDTDVTSVGTYIINPTFKAASPTIVKVFINPGTGGSTGEVFVSFNLGD